MSATWSARWAAAEPILAHAAPAADARQHPLAPLRVLDLSRLLPGPMACKHLADLGAQVLKVEPPLPGRPGLPGDDAAYMGPGEDGVSHFYRVVNHGKRRMVLDLKQPDQLATLRALVAEAHAVVEGFRPGVMERLGLGYEALRAIHPAIVLTSISGYGQEGPLRLAAGHDLNYLSLAGVIDQTRTPEGRPVFSHLQIADQLGGAQTAAIGTLAAVLGAQWTGQGRWVDVSMTDAVRQHQVILGTDALADGAAPQAGASLLNGGVPCYNLYRCADDRWLAVGALELKFWQGVCAVVGRDDWAERHWSLGEAPGSEAARALIDELGALIASRPLAVWIARFAEADCCVTPVVDAHEALFGRGAMTQEEGLRRLTVPAVTLR
ncbi:CaiB/BaiF CoA-transferase family protein [Sphaerotilus sp.]|uniref:CaiB/BaiF CoA transferase family protein n=1 Tax=Sphaerotilus sp. TaxID=2093942 RepID=UPI00286DF389|nr:CaiB/BaiF CoA-transferase family protein [Sphaerotilus sp.]